MDNSTISVRFLRTHPSFDAFAGHEKKVAAADAAMLLAAGFAVPAATGDEISAAPAAETAVVPAAKPTKAPKK